MNNPDKELPLALRGALAKADLGTTDEDYLTFLQEQAGEPNAHPEYEHALRLARQVQALEAAGETTMATRLTQEWQQSPWRDEATFSKVLDGRTSGDLCDANYFLEIILNNGVTSSG